MVPEPGGPGGPLAPPLFGRSVNPIPTGEGRLSLPITTGTPNVFHLPASLDLILWVSLFTLTCASFNHSCLGLFMLTFKVLEKRGTKCWVNGSDVVCIFTLEHFNLQYCINHQKSMNKWWNKKIDNALSFNQEIHLTLVIIDFEFSA